VYQPILKELEEYVVFKEQSMTYYGYKPDNTSRYFLVCSNKTALVKNLLSDSEN
jgi:hypothetical protein